MLHLKPGVGSILILQSFPLNVCYINQIPTFRTILCISTLKTNAPNFYSLVTFIHLVNEMINKAVNRDLKLLS